MNHDRRRRRTARLPEPPRSARAPRIIGGRLGGRKLEYSGDPRTRPMKDRVRQALFDLLGTDPEGRHVIDLFAGTGALGLEALSRGAERATFIERHFPTAKLIRANIDSLGMGERSEVIASDTFVWVRRLAQDSSDAGEPSPWLVLCSPPYDFYVERQADMLALLRSLVEAAPPDSVFAVEADERFDFDLLPEAAAWRVRIYQPAVIGIYRPE